ncbi:MAG: FAD-dependent oxidoreductase [Flavobacteriales bacterium]
MISFWEKQSLFETDVAIIGGGIVGLSVAASIKERWPQREVMVFERSMVPYGASTRNAGFACFGSLTEVISDIKIMGGEKARELLFNRWIGLKITRQRLTDERIGFQPLGGFELLKSGHLGALEQMDAVNGLVSDFIPKYVEEVRDGCGLGIRLVETDRIVSMRDEGQLDTGLLMKNLEQYAIELGVKIRTGASVESIDSNGDFHHVEVGDGVRSLQRFKAKEVVLCSNAFAASLKPELDVVPGRGQVLITKPIPELEFRGNLHLDEGFYYLRNVGDRILFGGGRNLDFRGETTMEFEFNDSIQNELDKKLDDLFAFKKSPEIDMRWSGIMAFGKHKEPIVQRDSTGILLALRMSGMGIALAGQVGEMIADLMD